MPIYDAVDMSILPEEYLPDDYDGETAGSIDNIAGEYNMSRTVVVCDFSASALRERLRTHKIFTQKKRYFYINYHKFSIKSYVLDVY